MKSLLSENEVKQLKQIQRDKNTNRKKYIKATTLLMRHQNMKVKQIEQILGVSNSTIVRDFQIYKKKGIEALFKNNYYSNSGKLNKRQINALCKYLDKNLHDTAIPLIDYLKNKYNIEYTVSGIHELLKRLGYKKKLVKVIPEKTRITTDNGRIFIPLVSKWKCWVR